MQRGIVVSLSLVGALVCLAAEPARAQESFDANLTNWIGVKDYWTYKEGVFTASAPEGIKWTHGSKVGNRATFLVSKKTYGDFELSFRMLNGIGHGVQVRGVILPKPKFNVAGPLAVGGPVIEWNGTAVGAYQEVAYGFLKTFPLPPELTNIDRRGFIHYSITAVGKRLTVKVNGVKTIDEVFPSIATKGVIAWHLESSIRGGEAMVHDIHLRDLTKGAKPAPKPKVAEPAQPAPPRFSAEATEVFAASAAPYWLDEREVRGGDGKGAVRLVKSAEPNIRELAQLALDVYAYDQMRTVQGRKAMAALEGQAMIGGLEALAKRAQRGEKDPGVGRLIEDMLGEQAQKDFNLTFLYSCLHLEQAAKWRAQMQALAEAKPVADIGVKEPLKIFCETSPERLGTISITNQSGRTLRHVLALGRVAVDAEAARLAGERENALGQFLLPAVGVTDKMKDASLQAAKLRSRAGQTDPGAMVYIPELAPGATARIHLAHWVSLIGAKSVDVSVFSDEVSVVRRQPANLYEVLVAAKYARYYRPVAGKK